MAVKFRTTFGAEITAEILDGGASEIDACSSSSQGLSQWVSVKWCRRGPGQIMVHSQIVHGKSIAQYANHDPTGADWDLVLNNLTSTIPQTDAAPFTLSGQKGQTVFDCGTVSSYDVWRNAWVKSHHQAQLSLQVN